MRTLELLERTRAAIIASIWPGTPFPTAGRLQAVVLSPAQFKRFYGVTTAGFVSRRGDEPPLLVLKGDPNAWGLRANRQGTPSTVTHELTHYLASYIYLRQPRWFAEGLPSSSSPWTSRLMAVARSLGT
jgi:hypothetical protein